MKSTPHTLPINPGGVLRIVISIFCASILLSCTGDTPVEPPRDRLVRNLEDARNKWAAKNPHNYSYQFRWRCYCTDRSQKWAMVTVRGDSVVSVMDIESRTAYDADGLKSYMPIDKLYDFIETHSDAMDINASFSDTYGMPTDVYIDLYPGYGEEVGFEAKGLTIN